MNRSKKNRSQSYLMLTKRNSLVGLLSAAAMYSTMFAGYSIVGNSLIGIFFAFMVIILSIDKIRLNTIQVLMITSLAFYFVLVLFLANDKIIVLQNIRYWFGVLIYILFFIARLDTHLVSFVFLRFLSTTILIESLLINTIVSSQFLHSESNEVGVLFLGWYERPLAFAGNPGTSGIALLVLFFMIEKLLRIRFGMWDFLLLFSAILALVSSTAIAGFMLLLLLRTFSASWWLSYLMYASIPLLIILFFLFNTDADYIQKFSIDYFIAIYNLKLVQMENVLPSDLLNQLLGSQLINDIPTTSGDFGWLIFVTTMGWVGIGIYLLSILSFYNGGKELIPVLLLMFIGTFHYPTAMSPAGQLILAMILTFGPLCRDNGVHVRLRGSHNYHTDRRSAAAAG